jgi:hypothetical protein
MSGKWRFSEVVKRARLDRETAQYALKHPEWLADMPAAGSQGVHREFTWRQATRLAICTHLVAAGISLKKAGQILPYIERRIQRITGRKSPSEALYPFYRQDPWLLKITDGRYVYLRAESNPAFPEYLENDSFDLEKGMETENCDSVYFTAIEINLSLLESCLDPRPEA